MSRRVTRSVTRAALASFQTNGPLEGRTPSCGDKKVQLLRTPASRKSEATPVSRLKKKSKLTLTPAIDDCIICMDQLGAAGGQVKLTCGHSFCRQCIATHAARQLRHDLPASCALCKSGLTEAELEGCGPAKEMQEESDDEDEPVLVIMEFDGDDEESGFWLMYDDEEYGSEDGSEDGWVTCDDEEEDDEEIGQGGGPNGEPRPSSAAGKGEAGEAEAGEAEQDSTEEDDLGDPDDPRPYGGWRWSTSHRAWVGNASVTCPPPRGPPTEPVAGPDPLEGQRIQGVLSLEARLELYGEQGPAGDGEAERGEGGGQREEADADAAEGAGVQEAMRALARATEKLALDSDA